MKRTCNISQTTNKTNITLNYNYCLYVCTLISVFYYHWFNVTGVIVLTVYSVRIGVMVRRSWGRDEIECSTTLKVNQASIKQDAARGTWCGRVGGWVKGRRVLVGAHDEEDAVNAMLMASSGDIVQQRGKWCEHGNEIVQGGSSYCEIHAMKLQWRISAASVGNLT